MVVRRVENVHECALRLLGLLDNNSRGSVEAFICARFDARVLRLRTRTQGVVQRREQL